MKPQTEEQLLARQDKRKKRRLSPRQEMFCRLYATDQEFFANGVQSYIRAYKPDQSTLRWYDHARVRASAILGEERILNRINELLEIQRLNDPYVDKQLGFLIHQHSDLSVKLGGIREYNRLKSRIEQKIKLSGKVENVLTPEQLNELLKSRTVKEPTVEGIKLDVQP